MKITLISGVDTEIDDRYAPDVQFGQSAADDSVGDAWADEPDLPEVAAPTHVQFGQRVCDVPLPEGLGDYDAIMDELLGYVQVLKGLADAPVNSPYLQLMEVATAYLVRGYEIEMLIHSAEHDGSVERGSALFKLRTGPLEAFINTCRRMADLGSRRLSQEDLLTAQRRTDGFR